MTEKEQIEEMAKDLEKTILGLGIHLCRKSAQRFFDLGYRKISKDSVVFTKEEYIDLSRNYVGEQISFLEKKLAITEKALELTVDDKCFAENCIAESFIGKGAIVRVPKKEQWYLEKAKEMIENE